MARASEALSAKSAGRAEFETGPREERGISGLYGVLTNGGITDV
nr:MAG TPA: hypothetical protein [Caudoviricetes sp.]DAU73831.1 MAG TPA: hypothetical protein [Caudoviricetes sp.]